MASRRPSTPLDLAILLVVVASCLTSLNGVAAETEEGDCAIHTNCSSCLNLNSTLNSSCQWLDCKEVDQSRCTNKTNEHGNCSIFTGHEQCLAPTSNTTITPPRTTASSPTPGNTTHIPSPKVTTATVISTTIPGTQPPRKSTFDASSFIGGIVLVLGLQAVIFFLYKFCKSKDQNYHTL